MNGEISPGENMNGKLRDKLKKALEKVGDILKNTTTPLRTLNPALIIARAAFLGLVRLNFRSFANRIRMAPPTAIKKFWENWGGDYNTLLSSVGIGDRKKALLPKKDVTNTIGVVDPVTSLTVALVAATPIIINLIKVLKEVLPKKEADDLDKDKDDIIDDLENENEKGGDDPTGENAPPEDDKKPGKSYMLPLAAAAGIALLLVMNNKKK